MDDWFVEIINPVANPNITMIKGISFNIVDMNKGISWTGITHRIEEPIEIDISAIITIGVVVEGLSLEWNKGK